MWVRLCPRSARAGKVPVTRQKAEEEWIEGARPVLEALRAGRRKLLEVWIPRQARSAAQRELLERVEACGLKRHEVELAREIRARARPLPESSLEDLLIALPAPRYLVALDGVTDVGNLGSIARSAETAGVQGLVLELRNSPPMSAAALRVSSGALEHLAVARTPNLGRALDLAIQEGMKVLAADLGGDPLSDLTAEEASGDLLWVFGSEDHGIRSGVLRRAQRRLAIPVRGRVESLGVAAAAAVMLHHTATLRMASRNPGDETR